MEASTAKERIEELKTEWERLWRERIDDRVRAEGIANSEYPNLFVEKGTIIFAMRSFRMPSFREIVELHAISDAARYLPCDPSVGG